MTRTRQALAGSWEVRLDGQDDWRPFPVPGQWHLAGLPHHEGEAFHRLKFTPVPGEGVPYLCFGGVDYRAVVRLNGTVIGKHEGYFQPFAFSLEQGLLPGENLLEVWVESPREEAGPVWPFRKQLVKGIFNHHDCRPGAWHPQEGQTGNTGGLWGDVFIEWRPRAFVEDLRVDVHLHEGVATLVVALTPGGSWPAEGLPVTVVCLDPAGVEVARAEALGPTLGLRVPDPKLWWSWDLGEQPLYTLVVEAGGDRLERQLGLRTITREGDAWVLNGRRIFLRGTNIIPAQYLSTYTTEQIAQDVQMMVDAGLNIVRVHAHVTRGEFYDACDAAGLMVWQDFALQWSYDQSPAFAAEACRQIKDMVRLLRLHPAIVAWCCHNEPVGQEHTLDPLLVSAVRSEDDSRLIRQHSDFAEHPYHGWYYGERASYETLPGAPLISEFGAQGLPCVETMREILPAKDLWPPNWERWAYHDFQYEQTVWIAGITPGDDLEDFIARSQAYQAELIADALDHYRRARFAPIVGVFQFMFVDGWPAITWSVVDHLRRPKLGYHALARAMSPVYLSLRLPARRLRAGIAVPIDLVLVNDLARALELTVEARLLAADGTVLVASGVVGVAIAADCSLVLGPRFVESLHTQPDWRGECVLEVVCREGEREHSRAHRPVVLDAWPAGLDGYKPVEML